ncbi:MAG: tetratricopeptide repeat protein [Saprospirales bacterium]|nr:tetratricopeptide repeat protein [Saprospirales bacterium]
MQLAEYQQALGYLDQAVRMDHELAMGYYMKAEVLLQLNRLSDALIQYDNAIYLKPEVPDFQVGKGNALFQSGRYPEAIFAFQEALSFSKCPEQAYVLLGRAYQENKQLDLALSTWYEALEKVDAHGNTYRECLHRLGQAEYLRENYPAAETAYDRLLSAKPDDFQGVSKLIQVYFANGQYQKGNALKMQLYGAYTRGLLPEEMIEKGFCFDQFMWEGKRVYAYERLEEPAGYYPKHLFLVTDDRNQVLEIIQTEHAPEASLAGKKYILGKTEGDTHILFEEEAFDDNFDYAALKKAVIRILRGKTQPGRRVDLTKKE